MNVPIVIDLDEAASFSLLIPGRGPQEQRLAIDDFEAWRFIACMTRQGDEISLRAVNGASFPAVIVGTDCRSQVVEVIA